MRFSLGRIKLQNFGTIKETELEFPEKGFVLVRGINECAQGKLSSAGAGKTLLGEALSRTCFGVSGRFSDYGHFSNDHRGNKETLVEVYGQLDRIKNLAVRSGYKHPEVNLTGEGLAYRLDDGKWISRGHLSKTREELDKILGTTAQVAEWTVYVDGDKLKFSDLGQNGMVQLVMASLNQPSWSDYADKAKTFYTMAKTESGLADARVEELKRQLARHRQAVADEETAHAAAVAALKRAKQEAATEKERITGELAKLDTREAALQETKETLQKEIKKHVDELAVAYKKYETERLTAKAALDTARREAKPALDLESQAKAEARRIKREISELEDLPDKCPTCNGALDRTHSCKKIKTLRRELTEAEEILSERSQLARESEDEIYRLDAILEKIERQVEARRKDATTDFSVEMEECDRKIKIIREKRDDFKDAMASNKVDDSRVTQAKYRLDAARSQLCETEQMLEEATANGRKLQKRMSIGSYLRTAFGPTGIPNMVLQEAIAPLNEASRIISARMTGNTITVQYSTTRQLVSQATKAELVVKVDNKFGSKRVNGNSKCESGLTNLIISETISEMSNIGSRVAFRWYDEVLRNPDETARRSFFAYVSDLAKRRNMLCFVVDHGPEAASYADHVLIAHKDRNKETTYRWE